MLVVLVLSEPSNPPFPRSPALDHLTTHSLVLSITSLQDSYPSLTPTYTISHILIDLPRIADLSYPSIQPSIYILPHLLAHGNPGTASSWHPSDPRPMHALYAICLPPIQTPVTGTGKGPTRQLTRSKSRITVKTESPSCLLSQWQVSIFRWRVWLMPTGFLRFD